MVPIAPDTQQNILYTIYFLVKHNVLALFFAIGIVCAIAWAIYRPSRAAVLAIVGFSLLLLGFEYTKHIAEPLIAQTTTSLVTERPSYRLAWFVEKFLGKGMPLLLYGTGFLSVGIATLLVLRRRKK